MKIRTLAPFLIILTILFSSCHTDKKKPLLPAPTGKPGEVLIVLDEYLIKSDIADFFRKLMGRAFEAIPQYEPIYDPVFVPTDGFSKLFKSHRNIITIKISEDYTGSKIIVQRDVWARYQVLVNVAGNSKAAVLSSLEENGEKLLDLLDQSERTRAVENYKRNKAKGVDSRLRQEHHISLSVPASFSFGVDTSNFVWLAHEYADLIQGILIYYYDYTDPNTFTSDYLIRKPNEFTRQYVPGPFKNSYMVVEDQYPVLMREMARDSTYVIELRGLWKLENGFMGGPFLSLTSLDEKRNRVVTVEGFVHAPGLDKRNYVRELEAILYTFTITD